MTLSEYLSPERPVERLHGGIVGLEKDEVTVWTNTAVKCRVVNVFLFDKYYQYRTIGLDGKLLFTKDDLGKAHRLTVFRLNF